MFIFVVNSLLRTFFPTLTTY